MEICQIKNIKMSDDIEIPEEVTAALKYWIKRAVRFDPQHPSQTASNAAKAAWRAFEQECINWENSERVRANPVFYPPAVFGPTGRGRT